MKNPKIKKIDEITGEQLSRAEKFHEATSIKNIIRASDPQDWPEIWKEIHFKAYPRFKQIPLGVCAAGEDSLFGSILERKSRRDFSSYPIKLDELSRILFCSAGITKRNDQDFNGTARAYPSAGARFPLETYVVVFNSDNLKPGLYHYNVKSHSLEVLFLSQLQNELENIIGQEWMMKASAIIIITAVLGRTVVKYGDRAYRYVLLESGHLGQNIYLTSEMLNMKCCAIGGFIDTKINVLLDLNPSNEFTTYILAIGK